MPDSSQTEFAGAVATIGGGAIYVWPSPLPGPKPSQDHGRGEGSAR